ncbi:hypothetical protein IZY60_11520 [Lutibacter sp. B2]|nr:hypothetical protein [Lutibacter sp. B2]
MKEFIEKCFKSISSLKFIIIVNITKAKKEQYNKHLGSHERTISYNEKLEYLNNADNVFICHVFKEFDRELDKSICSDVIHPSAHGNFFNSFKNI